MRLGIDVGVSGRGGGSAWSGEGQGRVRDGGSGGWVLVLV